MESSELKNRKVIEQAVGIGLIALLVFFCLLVLKPFFTAMLWAAILVFATWPVFSFIKRRIAGGNALAASGLMTLLATLLLLIPLWMIAQSSINAVSWAVERLQALRDTGMPKLMAALEAHPMFSRHADAIRAALTDLFNNTDRLTDWATNFSRVSVSWLVQRGVSIGYGIFQIVFSLIFMFFFYLRGEAVADTVTALMERVAGPFMARLRHRIAITLNTVVRGTVGTALFQAIVACIGFALFDVPNVALFTVLIFVLGMLPLGPPLLWVPLGLWLLGNERMADGIGLLIYGGVVISGMDNIVRPILIAGSWNFSAVSRRKPALIIGAITGALVGAGFAFAGLSPLIGLAVATVVGLSPFAAAGVVAFLGGAIWQFATGEPVNGVWLILFALALAMIAPILAAAVRRRIPSSAARVDSRPAEEGVPFAVMVIGVAGGMIAFGFIGLFLGPVLLALGYDLLRELSRETASDEANPGAR